MLKRGQTSVCIGLILLALLGTIYLSQNQKDYDKRTLQPYEYQDMAAGPMFFEKGTYTFVFHYTYAPDVRVEILRSLTADADNRRPAVLASQPLSQSGETALTVTFEETVYDIQLRYTGETELGFTTMESTAPVWRDTRLLELLVLLSAAGLGLVYLREKRRPATLPNDTGFSDTAVHALLLACAVYATLPAARDYLINGHDLAFHLIRIEAVKDGLLDGQFPVRIGPTFQGGMGYASSVMYPELFLYLPALLRLCGGSILVTYQIFVFLINLATLLTAYHAVKKLTGQKTIGLIVSVVYTLGVNRMITLYTRAAIGEVLALIFFPCVMLGMAEVLHKGKLSKWLIAGMTGLIQTHVVSVEIAAIACAAYTAVVVVLRRTTLKNLLRLAAAAGITVLLNLWFLAPFLRFTGEALRMFDYTTRTLLHAVYPVQWFASFVSPFGNAEYLGTTVEMPLSVGVLPFLGLLFYLLAWPRDDRALRAVGHASAGIGLFALLVSSTLFPWSYVAKVPVLGELLYAVQFPWRYLGLAGFCLAMVFGLGAYGLGREHRRVLIAACVALAVFNIAPFLDRFVQADGQGYVMRSKTDMAEITAYTTWDYDYADTDFDALKSPPMAVAAPGGVTISDFEKHGTHITFAYAADTEQTVTLPLYLYPGYRAVLNGAQALEPADSGNHLLALTLPAGEGTVSVWYAGFWYFDVANFVSLGTLVAMIGWGILMHGKKKNVVPTPSEEL